MEYILIAFLGYLAGCSNMAFYLSKLKGIDLKKEGTGNLGASNALTIMGKKAGILVGIHDILKATLIVLLIQYLFPDLAYASLLAGACCILGHIFPFYLHFKGGKGFASYIGMSFALDWKFTLILIGIIILVVLLTSYIVAGTTSTMVLVPIIIGYLQNGYIGLLILCIPSIIMIFKHIENYKRILNGTEIGVWSSLKGKHRKV